ncbi:MAG: threonine--tRNA ligase [Candidatus Omnitrophica bacterium]|nr:threonine--tRNA ligase [Candidatus Omnitrophota bacterium]
MLDSLRHSCSHVMAQAVKELWPDVKVAIGPAIEDGFYYDFDKSEPFTPQDLKKIEKRMRKITSAKLPIKQSFMPKADALKFFSEKNETYKLELIEGFEDEQVSIYTTGEDKFIDLCKGPHVEHTGEIVAFKLLSIAGAYWRGDENNARLQRIYGTCFYSQEELEQHIQLLEEAQKRDHRKLGIQLDLFNFYYDTAGAGLVFYHPNGAMLRNIIEQYVREEHVKRGYEFVITPNILKGKLWVQSGHADHYRENMYFFDVDGEEYAVKPMNCPGHMLIYKSRLRSYRDLPLKFFELGTVYRREKTGVLHGLLRVRGFTQDDAHIFCAKDQVQQEVVKVIEFVFDFMHTFGFKDLNIEVSTRPDDFIGAVEDWDVATQALEASLKEKHLEYQINEGDGAFYGPKIDIKLKDALRREWQCATIQCDFSLPERFNLSYTNAKGEPTRPIMIHRAIMGSVERFIGTLIEHYAGAFPVWLAPVQVLLIPIRESHQEYSNQVKERMLAEGMRVTVDYRNESLNKRIREGTLKKIPYIIIIGDNEQSSQTLAIRRHGKGDQGVVPLDDFLLKIKKEIEQKSLD